MSVSIVKKAMAIFGGDNASIPKKTDNKYVRQGWKQSTSLRKIKKRQKRKLLAKEKRENNALEIFKKKATKNHTRENVQHLLQLSGGNATVKADELQEILNYQKGRLSKNRPVEPKRKKKEESVFTEEDFEKFEREYIPKHKTDNLL